MSLTWEKSTTYDLGLDLDFLNNRLSFSGDYYRRYTTDKYTPSSITVTRASTWPR